ncbi:MAG: hypothetical protein RIU71_2074, partial [Pseudomonadota bacterium]
GSTSKVTLLPLTLRFMEGLPNWRLVMLMAYASRCLENDYRRQLWPCFKTKKLTGVEDSFLASSKSFGT